MTPPEPMAPAASGAIYDLGYRRYDGARLGRRAAVWALYVAGVRQIFGLGRSGRSKIIPFGGLGLMCLPAVIQSAVTARAGPVAAASGFTYDSYLFQMAIILIFGLAAQAPELLGGDQRHHVLALYFSHALERSDYALARLGAMFTGMLIITLVPLLVLFLGLTFGAKDLFGSFQAQLGSLPAIVGTAFVYSILYAAIGMSIAAFTPRRAYATAAIVAVFLVGQVLQALLRRAGTGLGDWPALLSINNVADGVRHTLFGGPLHGPLSSTHLPAWAYLGWATAIVVVGLAAYLWRYQRVQP